MNDLDALAALKAAMGDPIEEITKITERKMNTVYFAPEGAKGLNETSAAHLCAIAAQEKSAAEKHLESLSFVNTTMNIVGGGNDLQFAAGDTDLSLIEEHLHQIARFNAFIAWFAECRDEYEEMKERMKGYSEAAWLKENHADKIQKPKAPKMPDLKDWCAENGYEYPEAPKMPDSIPNWTMEDAINSLNIKDRNLYLTLEAQAAAYGKLIHEGNPFDRARDVLHKIVAAPYSKEGNGRDTIVYHHTPSTDVTAVDALYNKLQREYRAIEQNLNHMKSDLRNKMLSENLRITKENSEAGAAYLEERRKYDQTMEELETKYRNFKDDANAAHYKEYEAWNVQYQQLRRDFLTWKEGEMARLAKMKFAVPEALLETMNYLNNLGK